MLLHYILVSITLQLTNAELFSSIAALESLMRIEPNVVIDIKKYIAAEEERIKILKTVVNNYRKTVENANQNKDYLNPIGAHTLIKNIYLNWNRINTSLNQSQSNFKVLQDEIKFRRNATNSLEVTQKDYNGSIVALIRLQNTYNLKHEDFVQAKLTISGQNKTIQYPKKLTAKDCYDIGQYAYSISDSYHAVSWMIEAFALASDENKRDVLTLSTIQPLVFAKALLLQQNPEWADSVTKRFISKDSSNLEDYHAEELNLEHDLKSDDIEWFASLVNGSLNLPDLKKNKPEAASKLEKFSALCRGEVLAQAVSRTKKPYLQCFYRRNNPKYVRLFSYKIEIVHENPLVAIVKDIIDDATIEEFIQIAYPQLYRAETLVTSDNGETRPNDFRISQCMWINRTNAAMRTLSDRVTLITGLETTLSSRFLQVADYGIGGHFEPHVDYARESEGGAHAFDYLGTGNRIATMMLYLSDVELGGATVFPNMELTVFPDKKDAVFWYNLKANGQGDEQTLHGGCPVLAGHKWVANFWIHELYQLFRRPCKLDPLK